MGLRGRTHTAALAEQNWGLTRVYRVQAHLVAGPSGPFSRRPVNSLRAWLTPGRAELPHGLAIIRHRLHVEERGRLLRWRICSVPTFAGPQRGGGVWVFSALRRLRGVSPGVCPEDVAHVSGPPRNELFPVSVATGNRVGQRKPNIHAVVPVFPVVPVKKHDAVGQGRDGCASCEVVAPVWVLPRTSLRG